MLDSDKFQIFNYSFFCYFSQNIAQTISFSWKNMHDPTRIWKESDPRPKYACPDLETRTRMVSGKQLDVIHACNDTWREYVGRKKTDQHTAVESCIHHLLHVTDLSMYVRCNTAYSQNLYLRQRRQHMIYRSPHDKKLTVTSHFASSTVSASLGTAG